MNKNQNNDKWIIATVAIIAILAITIMTYPSATHTTSVASSSQNVGGLAVETPTQGVPSETCLAGCDLARASGGTAAMHEACIAIC